MVDGGEPGVDSRDERKHTGRNSCSFADASLQHIALQLRRDFHRLAICVVFIIRLIAL